MSYTIRSGSSREAKTLKRLCKNGDSYFPLATKAPVLPIAAHRELFFLSFFGFDSSFQWQAKGKTQCRDWTQDREGSISTVLTVAFNFTTILIFSLGF